MIDETDAYEESDAPEGNRTPRPIPVEGADDFCQRLRQAVGSRSVRGISIESGISQTALRAYIAGSSEPTRPVLIALSNVLGVSVEWLVTGGSGATAREPQAVHDSGRFALVPLYNVKFGGGKGRAILDSEQVIAHLSFSRYWLKKEGLSEPDLVCANCTGDSMQGVCNDGSVMLIDTSVKRLVHGAVMALGVDGGDDDLELLVKRIERLPDGSARLLSSNSAYDPVSVQAKDVPSLNVVGRVVWSGGRVS